MKNPKENEMHLSENGRGKLRLAFAIASTLCLCTLGVLTVLACYNIYISGDSPFTRESVGRALLSLILPAALTLLCLIGSIVVGRLFPTPEKKEGSAVLDSTLLVRLSARSDLAVGGDITVKIRRERTLRRILRVTTLVLAACASVVALVLCVNPARYTEDLNGSVLRMTVTLLLCYLPALTLAVAWQIAEPLSIKRELALLRALPRTEIQKEEGNENAVLKFFKSNEKPVLLGVRIAVVGAAVLYITLGVLNGGMDDVLQKAIKICTECIGLG